MEVAMKVVVCGGGIVGASTAYFLALEGADVTLVERHEVAGAASGKSGGFLALDWCDGQPVEQLARRSFHLHETLADALPGEWGYRRVTTYAGYQCAGPAREGPIGWTGPRIAIHRRLGGPATTAQVHPARLTRALVDGALAEGARLVNGTVRGWRRDRSGAVTGVSVGSEVVPCEAAVIVMGPWSNVGTAIPLPTVYGIKGHSLVFASGSRIPAEALFLEWRDAYGSANPEIFPRADGTTYVCALSSDSPLPFDPADVGPDEGAFDRLEAMCAEISPVLRDSKVLARQACYRPVTRDGVPIIGPVPNAPGVFVATGHGVWGILNGPATGEALAQLIGTGRATEIDLSAFDPARSQVRQAAP